MKVSIIGAGNIGGAIAHGLTRGTIIKGKNITVSDISEKNLKHLTDLKVGIHCTTSNRECVKGADIVILAVKPWLVDSIAAEIRDELNYDKQIVVCIAAGVPLEKLRDLFGHSTEQSPTLFRMIPNTAIDVMESFSCISSWNATEEQEHKIVQIFGELGKAMLVPETQLNAFMALSSCGIAYAFRYIRAASEGGVQMGIHADVAKEVVIQTLKGAIALLEASGNHPEAEIDKVTTAGGITIKGLNEMEHAGFTSTVIRGLLASFLG